MTNFNKIRTMKLIYKNIPNSKKYIFREIAISFFIINLYVLGISAYVALFLFPSYAWAKKPFDQSLLPWITVPIISFFVGLLHIHYRVKGSLKSRSIVMFILFLIIFFMPMVILFLV